MSTRQFYTYIHTKPNGEPFYVGKGSDVRYMRRSHTFRRRNAHHQNIVAKYGRENIGVHIFYCQSEQEALADEILHIAQLRRDGYRLANCTDGGDGMSGYVVSEETRAKLSAAGKGKKMPPRSEQWRERMSAAKTGVKIGPFTEESRARMSEAAKRRPARVISEEQKEKTRQSMRGKNRRPCSPEKRAKISATKRATIAMEGTV